VSERATIAFVAACAGLALAACGRASQHDATATAAGRFASDLAFLRQHGEVVLLADASTGAQVAVSPAYQGRVMTSTIGGGDDPSFGWIGRDAIRAGLRQPHMNVFGGEDRFWLGPEGGQYALYFKPGDPFDLDHWQVPGAIDWGAWDVVSRSAAEVRLRTRAALTNHAGTPFDLEVERTVRLLPAGDVARLVPGADGADVRAVAFESSNTVANSGRSAWRRESGLVSIWILGMFTPSPDTTIALPFAAGPEATLGPIVNDRYFGPVPRDRLVVAGSTILFRGDGRYRSKIGLPPPRALDLAGSYDSASHVLTLVQYTRPPGATVYVNSMWEVQHDPYAGDVVNSYNDGPPAPGKPPLGPFYELETSSPALALGPGERYTHVHRTIHLAGSEASLDRIARAAFHTELSTLAETFRAVRSAR
jgi:uncharacterized protein DUF6786